MMIASLKTDSSRLFKKISFSREKKAIFKVDCDLGCSNHGRNSKKELPVEEENTIYFQLESGQFGQDKLAKTKKPTKLNKDKEYQDGGDILFDATTTSEQW